MNFTEQQLINWSKPVSTSEDQTCQSAISQITKALKNKFGSSVSIFLQGSYRNNTNVRQNSDVDIVMRYDDAFYPDLYQLSDSEKATYEQNRVSANYTFAQLKSDTEAALRASFGANVSRKNKCIQVDGNSYRITADVIPCFVLRRYATPYKVEVEVIKFLPDNGTEVKSFPNQHYSNGTAKTQSTSRLYKRIVRILKVMNNRMIEQSLVPDKLASSFFIECLVYNVPDHKFINGDYTKTLRNVIAKIYEDMENNADYEEVSGLHWLFHPSYPRTRQDAKQFMQACWTYAGFV